MGQFSWAIDDIPGLTNFGKILVDYDIEFFIPIRTSGISSGYGTMITQGNATGSGNLFVACVQSFNSDSQPIKNFPPMAENNNFLEFGNFSENPLFTDANTVRFAIPGFYILTVEWLFSNTNNVTVTSLTLSDVVGIRTGSSTATTVADDVSHKEIYVIQTIAPEATLKINYSGDQPITGVQAAVYTLPNAMFTDVGDLPLSSDVLLVMSEADEKKILKRKIRFPSYFSSPMLRTLPNDEFKEFKRTGVMPVLSRSDVNRRLAPVRDQIARLLRMLPSESSCDDEDVDEKESVSEIPDEDPDAGVVVQPPIMPLEAPLAAKASGSGIGPWKRTVELKKSTDK